SYGDWSSDVCSSDLASGADHVTTPCRPLVVIVFGDGKGHPAAAGNEKHSQARVLVTRLLVPGCAGRFHSSTVAYELFFRLFACNTFFRRRKDFGVISTNSSSAMNSMACSRFSGLNGTRRMASSAVEARMFVSFFSRTAFTSRSVSLAFSPMIMPS